MSSPENAALQFDLNGPIASITPFGSGNINRTYLLTTTGSPPERTILQKINRQVFKHPRRIIENMVVITRHLEAKIGDQGNSPSSWRSPRIIRTKSGNNYFIDPDGEFWRAISFIENTVSYESVGNKDQAEKAGRALGWFHRLTGDLDPQILHDTLPGFHHTPEYLRHYDHIRATATPTPAAAATERETATRATSANRAISANLSQDIGYCSDFIEENRCRAGVLENARTEGRLIIRTIHGDPKISNVLFSSKNGDPVSLIDLDTVKPGLQQYDIGDFLRSVCNPAGEEATAPETVRFDSGLCAAALRGYFSEVGRLLTADDIDCIFEAVRLITFELGLRFFTDFLQGNVYFRAEHASHNLQRAVVQFKLAESILEQENDLQSIIHKIST